LGGDPAVGPVASLRGDRDTADVIVVVAGVEYPCHRCILAASSEVFRAMLYRAEMKEQLTGRVELDVSVAGWKALHRYCYDQTVRWTCLSLPYCIW